MQENEVDRELWYLLLDQINQVVSSEQIYDWLQSSFRPDSHSLFMNFSCNMNRVSSVGEWLDLLYRESIDELKVFYTILLTHDESSVRSRSSGTSQNYDSPRNPRNPETPGAIVFLINQSAFYHLFSNHLRLYQTERWGTRHRYATPLEERIVLRYYYSTYEFKDKRYETVFHRSSQREEFWPLAALLIALDESSSRSEMSSSIIYISDLKTFNHCMWRYFISLPLYILIGPTVSSWVSGDDFKLAIKIMRPRHPVLESWMKDRSLVTGPDFLAFCDMNIFIKGELIMLFRERFAPSYSLFAETTIRNNTTWNNTAWNNTTWDGLPIFSQELYSLMRISQDKVLCTESEDMMDLINPNYNEE